MNMNMGKNIQDMDAGDMNMAGVVKAGVEGTGKLAGLGIHMNGGRNEVVPGKVFVALVGYIALY